MIDVHALSLGLRCWPQWSDWLICYQTGALVDPYGQRYTPALIQAAALLLQLHELRDRAIFADVGQVAPVLEPADLVIPRLSRRDVAEIQRALCAEAQPPVPKPGLSVSCASPRS